MNDTSNMILRWGQVQSAGFLNGGDCEKENVMWANGRQLVANNHHGHMLGAWRGTVNYVKDDRTGCPEPGKI
jgi:hypothetical protein